MLQQYTIGQKLGATFGALLLLMAVLSYSSIRAVNALGASLKQAVELDARKIDLANAMGKRLQETVAATRGAQLALVNGQVARARADEDKMRAAMARIKEQIAELAAITITAEGKDSLARMDRGVQNWQEFAEQYLSLAKKEEFEQAQQVMDSRGVAQIEEMEAAVAQYVKRMRGILTQASENSKRTVSNSSWLVWGGVVLALAIGAAGFVILRGVNTALRQIVGDLTQGAEQLTGAAGQVSSGSQVLAQGASEQAASLEETSSSSEEIASMTRRNADNARSAEEVGSEVAEQVKEANQSLGEMVESMQRINASSDKISRINKVIDEIAFQTNILALNAAVEAARAGEAGMGFAVVADEVRNLAQRAAQAARDTSGLIEESIATAADGKNKLGGVAESITVVTSGAEKVKSLCAEVRAGSDEQSRGIEQIGRAIVQMQSVTQQSAATAEENAAAGQQLNAQAEALRGIVRSLSQMVGQA